MGRGRGRTGLGVVLALAILPSCAYNGLAFRKDARVSILAPADREEVQVPITLEWEAKDLTPGTTFAVFIDRSPPPPGRSVAWLFRDDDTCIPEDGCPDEEFLAERYIFVTDETELTIERLPRPADENRREMHEATIVLIGRDGDRLGESAFIREFAVEREDQ